MMDRELRDAVLEASRRAEAREGVLAVYAEVQREIDARRPICQASGRCCRFEEFGHRLYVTTLELAAFVYDLPPADQRSPELRRALSSWTGVGCPFQFSRLCGVHHIRPFGCRLFFCDATSTEWQNDLYERLHARLKGLHDTLVVPYFYTEWRHALRTVLDLNPGS